MTVALVALGGALGALARYGLLQLGPDPALTLLINVLGAFLLGVLVAHRPGWRAFAGTGVLGGFTTWSALAVQAVDAPGWLALSVPLGLAAAALGLRTAR